MAGKDARVPGAYECRSDGTEKKSASFLEERIFFYSILGYKLKLNARIWFSQFQEDSQVSVI